MKTMKTLAFALPLLVASAFYSQAAITDAEVASAADTLLKSPKEQKAWQTLREVVRDETCSVAIRSRAMYLFALSNLLQMNTNLYAAALQAMQKSDPAEGPSLAGRLTPADWLVACPKCGGTGVREPSLPGGQGVSPRCLDCLGTGKIFQLSLRVKDQLVTVLGEVKALAAENIRFADAARKAVAESNPPRRVAALRELTAKYAHRKDLDGVKQALTKTESEIEKENAIARQRQAEQALREQEARDYRSISASLENLPDSGIPVLVREIDRFIEKYPKSSERLELEISKTKLQQREKIHTCIWRVFLACMVLMVLSSTLSFAKTLFAHKKKLTGPLPVPGLTKTNEASDPLAGTFADDEQP